MNTIRIRNPHPAIFTQATDFGLQIQVQGRNYKQEIVLASMYESLSEVQLARIYNKLVDDAK